MHVETIIPARKTINWKTSSVENKSDGEYIKVDDAVKMLRHLMIVGLPVGKLYDTIAVTMESLEDGAIPANN